MGPSSTRLKDEIKVLQFPKARQWLRAHDLDEEIESIAAAETAQHIHFQVDDLIRVLLRGNVPLVLRPENETCGLWGECYVHGTMDGEATGIIGQEAYADFAFL